MLDSTLRRLLEEVVNSSTKLAIVVLYAGQRRLVAAPADISQRVCRDIWSVQEALQELADDGILMRIDGCYHYAPAPKWHDGLARLMTTYDEPLRRQEIMRIVGDLDRYAPYRDMFRNGAVTVFST